MLSRRRALALAGGALGALALPVPAMGAVRGPTVAARPPLTDLDGVLAWIRDHPGRTSILVDDGVSPLISHRARARQPAASAVKVLHLAAYARAVVGGRLSPDQPVRVADWERWYLPGVDGGNHLSALEALGVDSSGVVRLDDVVASMITFSDNAAADMLRARLRDDALRSVARDLRLAPGPELPTFLGEALIIPSIPTSRRRARASAAARRYLTDPRYRAEQASRPPIEDVDLLLRWADGGPTATCADLVALHRALATGRLGPRGTGAIARRHLERGLADRLPAGVAGIGTKNGLLPGVSVDAVSVRWEDGRIGCGALGLRGLDVTAWSQLLETGAAAVLLQQALLDPGVRDRLARSLPRPTPNAFW